MKQSNSINWDEIYNKIFSLINEQGSNYFSGERFISLVKEVKTTFPNYNDYITQRQAETKSTSRKDYFRDIFLSLKPLQRFNFTKKIVRETYRFNSSATKELELLLVKPSPIPDFNTPSQFQIENSMQIETKESRKVFVVHGRNLEIRNAIFSFLRSIDLDPMEWSEARRLTGKPNPYVGEIIDAGFSNAQAALVLFTPDDEARLIEHFIKGDDEQHEKQLTPQPRQNVTFEAGMAMGKFPERTVLVQVGKVRPMSDISGLHILRLNNSSETRQELAERLKDAGCAIKIENKTNWHTEGNFELKALHSQETEMIKVKSASEQLPEEGINLLGFLTENSNDDTGILITDIVENSQIPKPKILYYLDLFEDKGFVFSNMDFTRGKEYRITSDGRKYYFENI